jgi:NTE family protein
MSTPPPPGPTAGADPVLPRAAPRQQHQDQLLTHHLQAFLGDIGEAAMALLREHLQWCEIAGGQTLMTQGAPGDSMYITVSGRLRAYVRDDDGAQRAVREMGRGEIIGEMSLYTDAPRSATVVAIRDSVLVRLDKSQFRHLLESSSQVSIALTRQIIQRLQSDQRRGGLALPVTIGLLPISAGVDLAGFGRELSAQMARIGSVRVVDAQDIARHLQQSGIVDDDGADDAQAHRLISQMLDEIEAAHEFVLLLGDDSPTPWTRRCSRHCDELLLVADATAEPRLHPIERLCLLDRPEHTEATEVLVLLHPPGTKSPRQTRAWLDRRPLTDHVHLRLDVAADMARLARIESRTAVGLVMAGGGARGIAHLGVWQALYERGFEFDYVGGTSIGAVMATLVAADLPPERVLAVARKAFRFNPTGDFNLIPLLSLIKGRRLRDILAAAIDDLFGADIDCEDLWKGYFCIATNYSKACEQQVRRGNLAKALLASIAIPGALPPVIHDGDLLCDGSTFNNFPVDVMQGLRGVGTVIGIDLNFKKPHHVDHDDMPGNWALLRDRLRPQAKRRYRFPSLAAYLVNVTILYSMSRQRRAKALTDLYFNPPLDGVSLLDWHKFDQIVRQGHAHALAVLDSPGARSGAPAMGAPGLSS